VLFQVALLAKVLGQKLFDVRRDRPMVLCGGLFECAFEARLEAKSEGRASDLFIV
jgi:hypothetical protein